MPMPALHCTVSISCFMTADHVIRGQGVAHKTMRSRRPLRETRASGIKARRPRGIVNFYSKTQLRFRIAERLGCAAGSLAPSRSVCTFDFRLGSTPNRIEHRVHDPVGRHIGRRRVSALQHGCVGRRILDKRTPFTRRLLSLLLLDKFATRSPVEIAV